MGYIKFVVITKDKIVFTFKNLMSSEAFI